MDDKVNEVKDENNKLYQQLKNRYEMEIPLLKKQKEHLKQLQDFSKAILTIDDTLIEKNLPFTMQKRNKAPQFISMELQMQDVQQKIDDIEN